MKRSERGYSLLELMVTVGIGAVISAIAIPMIGASLGNFRLGGDAHSLNNALSLTKMRAAASFTRSRLFVDLSTNAFHLETWNNTTSTWTTEGGSTTLAQNDIFSFGVVNAAPPNTQTPIAEATPCMNTATPAVAIANTACVLFNSRGIPVDGATLNPTGNYALYITDGTAVFGSTISATGSIRSWRTNPRATPNWGLQ